MDTMETESLHCFDQITPRCFNSLALLATKFVNLMAEAGDGQLDLREALKVLAVKHKRRIYDITNVLEGIGLIVKKSPNVVQWKTSSVGQDSLEFRRKVMNLQTEVEELKQKEYVLDQQKHWVEQSISNTREDYSDLTYVNHEDISKCFTGHTLLAVRAPSGSQVDVPIPKAVKNSPQKFQMHLKSTRGPINVLLLNKNSSSLESVIFPLPPPVGILKRTDLTLSRKTCRPGLYLTSADRKHSRQSKWSTMIHSNSLHESSFTKCIGANDRTLQELSKELRDLVNQHKEKTSGLNASLLPKPVSLHSAVGQLK
ncbi:transcription factor E2F5-like isoform X2 [Gouania willdenowi]|uniref:transcription factor E2F5-like isoform X2 n=1 Tax=Gouania willdenowi TaxID=441366 RepID=UPI0010559978|nr:transcription factor E2F5-like isoform X2 [Gouania willdenowi]